MGQEKAIQHLEGQLTTAYFLISLPATAGHFGVRGYTKHPKTMA